MKSTKAKCPNCKKVSTYNNHNVLNELKLVSTDDYVNCNYCEKKINISYETLVDRASGQTDV